MVRYTWKKGWCQPAPRNQRSKSGRFWNNQAENRPFLAGAVYFRLLNSNSVTINAPNVSIKLSASNTVTGFTPLLGRVSRPPLSALSVACFNYTIYFQKGTRIRWFFYLAFRCTFDLFDASIWKKVSIFFFPSSIISPV